MHGAVKIAYKKHNVQYWTERLVTHVYNIGLISNIKFPYTPPVHLFQLPLWPSSKSPNSKLARPPTPKCWPLKVSPTPPLNKSCRYLVIQRGSPTWKQKCQVVLTVKVFTYLKYIGEHLTMFPWHVDMGRNFRTGFRNVDMQGKWIQGEGSHMAHCAMWSMESEQVASLVSEPHQMDRASLAKVSIAGSL